MFARCSTSDLNWTFAPKAVAAARLHAGTAFDSLSALLFFSSAAATFGQLGQANYAAANSYMDTLAESRREIGASATSLQLVLVLGAGMGRETLDGMAGARGAEVAQWNLQMEQYAEAAWTALALPMSGRNAASVVLDASWIMEALPAMPVLLGDAVTAEGLEAAARLTRKCTEGAVVNAQPTESSGSSSKLLQVAVSERQAHVEALVLKTVGDLTSAADVGIDTPLMEAGVDSLAATELSSSLRASTEIALSPTLLFEQPTARAIATHVVEMLADVQAPAAAACSVSLPTARAPLGLSAGAVLWPGDVRGKVSSIGSRMRAAMR